MTSLGAAAVPPGRPPEFPGGTAGALRGNLRLGDGLHRWRPAGVIWLAARPWLGCGWLITGYQELRGSEKAAFRNGGAEVEGSAVAGVAGSGAGIGGASCGWRAAFLHGVIPGASRSARQVTLGELVPRIPGPSAWPGAVAAVSVSIIYVFSGSAGASPAYALVTVSLILACRNAGYFAAGRLALPRARNLLRRPRPVGAVTAAGVPSRTGMARPAPASARFTSRGARIPEPAS
jgi:hypothetical protein